MHRCVLVSTLTSFAICSNRPDEERGSREMSIRGNNGERNCCERNWRERSNFSCLICQETRKRESIMVGPTTFTFLP
ncbi:hypothetical protein MtrunA17_Chr3g0092711 [Medicago truncatula]|uniref:Uncharacterized protein n=1 Tax=Medicago truncatula TaxID=3880 RepID=A0A396ILZ3_MEDTR|nr:hypothetical protein MtrunA17_Chr3g0092711 [Medicago truncatula]